MADETKRLVIPVPRNRDYAEGFCHALKVMAHNLNFATLRAKKKEMPGLETAFNLSKMLHDAMTAHLETMTGEAANLPVNPLPLSEVDPEPEDD